MVIISTMNAAPLFGSVEGNFNEVKKEMQLEIKSEQLSTQEAGSAGALWLGYLPSSELLRFINTDFQPFPLHKFAGCIFAHMVSCGQRSHSSLDFHLTHHMGEI